ncbi:TetR family transcriptional regulator [Streptomyces sp. CNQ-509]|uniref:TetR/AcrR family transcriptional regulator n=1 Tax=Streptomyces sp. CNQ-509 TaxID=444103 RepID=UPI00062E0441|nr:TetR family transcriptional regulator [Streptomyces sp. CNQ-509]AKH83759.1 TetR family transcriptional regulator [Streptomyces sp. CNQ-509]
MTPENAADPPKRGRGRPRRGAAEDGPGTRDRILAKARSEFAARGFEKTSIRGIAKSAGVDPALVHHYFGTKERVFEAALEITFAPAMAIPDIVVDGPAEDAGERMTRFFFGVWENRLSREPLLAVIRSAVSNETAAAIFRKIVTRNLLRRITPSLPQPDAEMRAELAVAQLVGTAMLRYIVRLEPMASAAPEELIRRLSPIVQYHLMDGPPSPPAPSPPAPPPPPGG